MRPYVLRIADDPGVVGQCTPDVFHPLESCAAPACATAPALVPCVVAHCPDEVAALSGACVQCLLDHAEDGSFEAIRGACVGGSKASRALPPEKRSYLSGGSYGIGLLSSFPFADQAERALDSSTVRRGVIYARIDDTPMGRVHVFCTHLGAILPGVMYEGSYEDWTGENAHHADDLIAFVRDTVPDGELALVLGDLNNGPAGEGIVASEPDNYAKFAAAGFADPFLSGPHAACTFCRDNPLVNPDDEGVQAALDHVLTRGPADGVVVERILDELIDIDGAAALSDAGTNGVDAGPVVRRIALSDHYGLRGVLTR